MNGRHPSGHTPRYMLVHKAAMDRILSTHESSRMHGIGGVANHVASGRAM